MTRYSLFALPALLLLAALPAEAENRSTIIIDNDSNTRVVHRSNDDISWLRDRDRRDRYGSLVRVDRSGRVVIGDDRYEDSYRGKGPNCNRGRKVGNPHC